MNSRRENPFSGIVHEVRTLVLYLPEIVQCCFHGHVCGSGCIHMCCDMFSWIVIRKWGKSKGLMKNENRWTKSSQNVETSAANTKELMKLTVGRPRIRV